MVAIFLAGLMTCSGQIGDARAEELRRIDVLIVPADAVNVRDSADYDGAVSYDLPEPFPPSTLSMITQTLEQRGWRPLTDDLWNPGLPSSHARGWTSAREDGATFRGWSGEWENAGGDVVSYAFVYRTPDPNAGAPPPGPAKVVAIFLRAATAKRVRDAGRR